MQLAYYWSPWTYILCRVLLTVLRSIIHRRRLPPGPPNRSWWASLVRRDVLPTSYPWKVYHLWSNSVGPIVHLNVLGQDTLILNGIEVANTLLESRSKIYANRPMWRMAELAGRQDNVGFTYYGPKLKRSRALLHSALNAHQVDTWAPLIEKRCNQMLIKVAVADRPADLLVLTNWFVATLVTEFTYGMEITDEHIFFSHQINLDTGLAIKAGRWAVDYYPWLKYIPSWLPGAHFKRWAQDANQRFQLYVRGPFDRVAKETMAGVAPSCFVSDMLSSRVDIGDEEDVAILAGAAASIYGAATDTTTALIRSFIYLMCLYPEIQEKASNEILAVTGGDRLPTLADKPRLPYIEALIRELHRFRPVVNLVPRSALNNDDFEGYHIPSKIWLLCNIWSMVHDEGVYPQPDVFDPTRFLDSDGVINGVKDPRDFTFGFGRRACPGIHFANAATFLYITRVLSLFKLQAAATEKFPDVEEAYSSAFVSEPQGFACELHVRHKRVSEFLHLLEELK